MGFGEGLGRGGRPAGPPGGAGRRRPQAAGNRRRRFALRAGLWVCRGLRRGGAACRGWEGRQGQGVGRRVRGAGQGRRPNRPEGGFGGRRLPAPAEPGRPAALFPPPAQNEPRSYRNRKTVSAAREWWRRSGQPTTVQGVSAPVRRTVSGTRYFCARPTLRGCSTLAPCSAISSISA